MSGQGVSPGVVARRLRVAVTTLRSWHTRYGIGPTGHQAGQHRRYTEHDVERLRYMIVLIKGGVQTARAARQALAIQERQ